MVIGGIAVIARGVRRMTTDIDAVVRGDAIELRELLPLLATHRIAPRIDDAIPFAQANHVLLLRHQPSKVELDLSFGWTLFEHEALAARTIAAYGRVEVPMATPEDLVIMKAMAARPVDLTDAVDLLIMYPAVRIDRARRKLDELAEAAGEPLISAGLDQILKLVPRFERESVVRPVGKKPIRRRTAPKPR